MPREKRTEKKRKIRPICIECPHARFPTPREQCYKFGGLICTKYDLNVGKYNVCCEEKNENEG